jgi:hypothetical protein
MIRRSRFAAAAAAVAVLVGGCGSVATATTGPYWLVKVRGDYANLYRYPKGYSPGTSAAVELGTSDSSAKVRAAAARLGVPDGHITTDTAG